MGDTCLQAEAARAFVQQLLLWGYLETGEGYRLPPEELHLNPTEVETLRRLIGRGLVRPGRYWAELWVANPALRDLGET